MADDPHAPGLATATPALTTRQAAPTAAPGKERLVARNNNKSFDVDALWRIERLGAPSLSPDGAQAVLSVTRHSMDDNKSASTLWLLSTLGGAPRALTHCGDKDAEPRFGPRGDLVAFVARREQEGAKDDEPQLYVIAPDGGEARRAATVATGVDAFRWSPGGRTIAFVSWVWPDAKGAKAQAKKLDEFRKRKETGYLTGEVQYRFWDRHLPMGRVPHLHLLELGRAGQPGKVHDLFEGTPYELRRADPGADDFDLSPDGTRLVFAFDPAPEKRFDGRYALAEMELRTRKVRTIVQDAAWDFGAPRYAPDGNRIAFLASHQALKHTAPAQLAVWDRETGAHDIVGAQWDHEPQAPLHWEDDGQALLFVAEQKGRQHLWRFDLPDRRAEIAAPGGWVSHFDKAAGTLVTLTDTATHPARAFSHVPGAAPRRIERFNDALLARVAMGRVEERWLPGAQGDDVQVWLTYPPGFDAKKKHPLLQVIHGGPHTALGDSWHYRWNAQTFAARGYVVACVNYHGSSGFGYVFKDSISHRWGQLEQQDVEATTTALLKERWADARRVFAAGGSYGGFMVAWLNGHVDRGRYAAYVCHAGCFDWTAMFADDAYTTQARELGAWYWDDMAQVHRQSPHAFAGAMATPTLVVHGALDYRVPDAQGLAYYNTLKARGVDARLLWFPDENHWVLKPRNSKLWYEEFFGWLERHDRPARR
jgi:dipeptidyl aminopeptidase/acylaminoacyl peptidase